MQKIQVAVVGAGPAGASAAIEAARHGLSVTLIDENPIDFSTMGLDIPYYFGQRMLPSLRDRGVALQRVISSNPLLSQAQEAGVELQLGTYVWGSFRSQENSHHWERPVLGLANEEESWLLDYDYLIFAPGARDLVFGVLGRELVGVIGANAAACLLDKYKGLTAGKMVVLGSGPLGLSTALKALENGIGITGVVDVSPTVRGPQKLRQKLGERGVSFYTSCTVKEARGRREVQAAIIARIDGDARPIPGTERELECDTLCMAFGLVPSVELPYLTGCALRYNEATGDYFPILNQDHQTDITGIYAAGDGAGFSETMALDPGIAEAQGKLAAIDCAASLGALGKAQATSLKQGLRSRALRPDNGSTQEYRSLWLSSLINIGGMEVNVCECEKVTRQELLKVAVPKYLGWRPIKPEAKNVNVLVKEARPDLDRLKRLTRAGMGYCQGCRCREETAMLVAREAGVPPSQIPPTSYRPPVRPLPLKVMWPHEEPEELRKGWQYWIKDPSLSLEELAQD